MTITKAAILTEVKARLGLSISNIDDELLTIMQEAASVIPGMLQKTDTVTISAAGNNIALPADIINPVAVTNSSGVPLVRKPFQLVIAKLRADTTAATPEIYGFFDDKIYVHPKCLAETVLTIYYNHDETSVNSIGAPDEAKECYIEGVCYQIQLGKGLLNELPPGTITHKDYYERQIKVLQARYRMFME